MIATAQNNFVAIIGEVLFDQFPDGRRTLGGAPFNVAWNLCGIEIETLLLAAVGQDEDGQRILEQMQTWGLNRTGVQIHEKFPTGSVVVTVGDDGEPNYEITQGVAYDELAEQPSLAAIGDCDVEILYHGSLCFRTDHNRRYLQSIVESTQANRFVDLNLREPWVNRDWLPLILGDCRWLKLSSDELAWLSEVEVEEMDLSSVRAAVDLVNEKVSPATNRTCLVTCGEQGAFWIGDDVNLHAAASPIETFVDSVGAGDAFTAASIRGLMHKDDPETILHDAVKFAARACTIQGATSNDRTHYQIRAD